MGLSFFFVLNGNPVGTNGEPADDKFNGTKIAGVF
jgi:hypothetical protein